MIKEFFVENFSFLPREFYLFIAFGIVACMLLLSIAFVENWKQNTEILTDFCRRCAGELSYVREVCPQAYDYKAGIDVNGNLIHATKDFNRLDALLYG